MGAVLSIVRQWGSWAYCRTFPDIWTLTVFNDNLDHIFFIFIVLTDSAHVTLQFAQQWTDMPSNGYLVSTWRHLLMEPTLRSQVTNSRGLLLGDWSSAVSACCYISAWSAFSYGLLSLYLSPVSATHCRYHTHCAGTHMSQSYRLLHVCRLGMVASGLVVSPDTAV